MNKRSIPQYPDLVGKVAFVTGGSSWLGASTCRLLAANGVRVAVSGRNQTAIDEVVGTIGQLPDGAITLVQSVDEVARFVPRDPDNLAYATQTTLSVDDTAEVVRALKARFPKIHGPSKEDICYATTNRQEVVKKVAPRVDLMLVVGSPNSSNTQRLREVAERAGCPRAMLVQRASELDWSVFAAITSLGITAGASAPEVLVEEVIGAFAERFTVNVETVTTADEDMFFPLPRALRGDAAAR